MVSVDAAILVFRPSASRPSAFQRKVTRSRFNEPSRCSISVPAVGGSWMVPADVVDAGDFASIEQLCAEAVAAAAAL